MRPGVSHATRAPVARREPVLVTLKVGKHVWNMRTRRAFARLVPTFAAARERLGMRIVHFSVQRDHIHLLVEAHDTSALSRGVQGLSVRIARALNRMMARRGKVFADRFHHRVLKRPRQVRNALAYVLCNARKHGHAPRNHDWVDPYSSARAFDGWRSLDRDDECVAALITVNARTWLLASGWRRAGGLIEPDHCPGALPSG